MVAYKQLEDRLAGALRLQRRPVAVAFRESPPPHVPKFTGVAPSGCSFWRIAAEGRTFYTVPADHFNCPIGSYTHNVPLPEHRAVELQQTLELLTGISYIKMDDIPGIFGCPVRRPRSSTLRCPTRPSIPMWCCSLGGQHP
jgi:hypothetical protein